MNIILLSPWKNVWVDYMKIYFESLGHTFTHSDKLNPSIIAQHDVMINGWADDATKWLGDHPKLCPRYFTFVRSYEFWHNNLDHYDFSNYDKVFYVNEFIAKDMNLEQGFLTRNAIDLSKFEFKEHYAGKRVLLLADVNFKKGIPLLVQVARALPDFEFNVYGNITDKRNYMYLRYCNLPNLKLRGYTNDIKKVFDYHSHIILTSPVEGNPNCIIEGMASGLKPVVHNFVGSGDQFPFYWETIEQAKHLLISNNYNSHAYRQWVEDRYDMWKVYPELAKQMEII